MRIISAPTIQSRQPLRPAKMLCLEIANKKPDWYRYFLNQGENDSLVIDARTEE
jgi:hypothetical protein